MRTLLKKGRTPARAGLSKKVLYRACAKVGKSSFGNVQISFTGANPSSLTTYQYDDAGNRTSKVQNDDTGVILTETTTVNDLNQVVQRVVTTSSGTVTWDYSYSPDGTLASKTNGTVTTTYTFNDQQQLVQVTDTTGLNVVNTFDTLGRWLTRTDSTGTRTFEWDGMNVIGETGPEGTTRYFCPQGQIHSFSRGGVVYQLHADALGSVRMITDPTGAVVARFDTDVFGNPMVTNFDSVPGGFNYVFVGALGVRQDTAIGLIYMRARWVDGTLGKFVSRNRIGRQSYNLYAYCGNNPINFVDPSGLDPLNYTPGPTYNPPTYSGGPTYTGGPEYCGGPLKDPYDAFLQPADPYSGPAPGPPADPYNVFLPPPFINNVIGSKGYGEPNYQDVKTVVSGFPVLPPLARNVKNLPNMGLFGMPNPYDPVYYSPFDALSKVDNSADAPGPGSASGGTLSNGGPGPNGSFSQNNLGYGLNGAGAQGTGPNGSNPGIGFNGAFVGTGPYGAPLIVGGRHPIRVPLLPGS